MNNNSRSIQSYFLLTERLILIELVITISFSLQMKLFIAKSSKPIICIDDGVNSSKVQIDPRWYLLQNDSYFIGHIGFAKPQSLRNNQVASKEQIWIRHSSLNGQEIFLKRTSYTMKIRGKRILCDSIWSLPKFQSIQCHHWSSSCTRPFAKFCCVYPWSSHNHLNEMITDILNEMTTDIIPRT